MFWTLWQFFYAALFACLIHEYGHLTTALFQGVHVKQIGWHGLRGPYIRRSVADGHIGEIMISAAGPLANLYAAFFIQSANPFWFRMHLILAIGNLLPVMNKNSDGARILRHVLVMFRTQRRLTLLTRSA
jgi:Zn-dependent protease